jgi:hypothetical protein
VRDRYTLIVGLFFAAVILIVVINGTGGDGGTLGLDEQPRHWPLPEFAVPLAAEDLEGDANVAQDDCETSLLPCPDDRRRTPACRVGLPGSFAVCDLFDRPSVISFFTSGADCVTQQDVVSAASERYRGRVAFLSVDLGDDRESVRDLIRERGWKMPVGLDPDGAVGALYRVGVCPTLAFVFPGGTLQDASVGELAPKRLEAKIGTLLRATRDAESGTGA